MDYAAIWNEANEAGAKALAEYTEKYGYDRGSCGFAWITIRPARGKFVSWCKNQNDEHSKTQKYPNTPFGDNGWSGGWVLWAPGSKGYSGQSVNAIESAAQGFAKVLEQHGIKADVGSRLD